MQTVRKYAKAVVAVGGFVVLVAAQVADGHIDAAVIYTAAIGALTTLGVVRVANRAE